MKTDTWVERNTEVYCKMLGMAQKLDLDELICKLLNVGSPGCSLTKTVKEQEIMHLCSLAKEVFLSQNSLIEVDPPIRICGDTHGQYAGMLD